MAFGGLLTVLDDVTSTLDDVASMSKVAAGRTAAISGDDLAVNSAVVQGFDPKRELSIIWQITKGSFRNKAILIPAALALGFFVPAAIAPILMIGGAYFCYEGMHKILHRHKHGHAHGADAYLSPEELKKIEKEKIKGAVRTDFILSAEIIAITLATVAAAPLLTQVLVLGAIGIATTVGIYGLVGGIVKLDDIGLHLSEKEGDGPLAKIQRAVGNGLITAAPKIMKGLGVVGTGAMLLVGGGLILHGLPFAHHAIEGLMHALPASGIVHGAAGMAVELVAGVASGIVALGAAKIVAPLAGPCKKLFGKVRGLFKKESEEAPKKTSAPQASPEASVTALHSAEKKDVAAALNNAAARKPAEQETAEPGPVKKAGYVPPT